MLGRPDMDAALTDDDDDQLQHSHRPPTNAEVGDDLLGRACRGGEMGWSGMGGAAHGKDSSSSDDDLAHCVRAPPAAATHAKRSTSSSSSSSSSSSDDDWGVVRTCHIDVHRLDASTTSSSSSDDDGLLFMPEPVFKLNSLHKKPDLPYHTKEDLRNGSSVWIVDEEDVETHLRSHWSLSYKRVCNGRLRGTVVRHLGDMTVVQFQADQGFIFSLTMPRPCLSLKRIDAYDSPSGNFNQLVSSCYLNLGPRATRGRSEGNRQPRSICQQYYELLPVLDVPSASVAFLGDAQTKFQQGLLSQALKLVDEALEIVKNGSTIVDALVLRSRIYVFMEQYGMALDAAKECIRRDPQCARGFLCAARAHSGLGNFSSAGEALAMAISLDPQGDAFRPLVALNQYMMDLQLELEKRTDALRLTLDFMYCKRLQACRAIPMGTLVMTEDMPIMATHSLFSLRPPTMCSVCLREGAKEMEVNINGITAVSPINMSSPSSNTSSGTEKSWLRLRPSFCCPECHARSMLYIPMEQQHKESVANAKELIIGKASVTLDTYPLEMGYMTIRLFFVVVTTHCRLASLKKTGTTEAGATLHVVPIEAALRELGIFPLASDGLTVRTREEALIVYRVLTNKFRPEDKEIYSSDLFVSLYNYVRSYFTPVKISDHNTTTSRATRSFYLPYLIGCADRDKTLCCFSSGGKSFFPSTELSCAKTTVPNCKVQLLLDSDMAALRQKDRHGDLSPASQPPRTTEEETRSGPTSDTEGDFPKRRPLLKLIAWTDIKDGEWLMLPPFVIDTIEH